MIKGLLITLTAIIAGGYSFVTWGTGTSFWPGMAIVVAIIVAVCAGMAMMFESINTKKTS